MMLSVRSKGRPASAGRVLFVVLACVCLAEASSLTRRRPARIASSTVSPFSRDGRYLLLRHESGFGLYDAEGRFLRNLPRQIDAGAEPRWSSREPSVLYYLNGNQLRSVDVDTGEATLVRLFDEYGSVRGLESDLCADGDHLVLAGDERFIFVYEISTGRKRAALDAQGHTFTSLQITPDDHVLVGWSAAGRGLFSGIELFDANMELVRQVAPAAGPMDVTRDADGAEVVVLAAADGTGPCAAGLVKVRLADGSQTCLLALDPVLGVEVAAPDAAGWVLAVTYVSGDASTLAAWPPYANEVLQVRLDGSALRRIAHRRAPFDSATFPWRVSSDRAGARAVFSGDDGVPSGLGSPLASADVSLFWPAAMEAATEPGPLPLAGSGDGRAAPASTAPATQTSCGLADDLVRRPTSGLRLPPRGGRYVDPVFGCTVTRLTNSASEGTALNTHLYSSVNPFNATSSLVLLQRDGGVMHVRDLAGNVVKDNLGTVGILPNSDPFWSRTNPNLLYFHEEGGNQLKSYDISTGVLATLHDFAGYGSVSFGLGEGDLSFDGDHLPVVADGRRGFVYTISTGVSTPAVDLSAYASFIDNMDLTPLNRVTLIHDGPGGTKLFDPSMRLLGTVLDYQGHSDRGRDIDGADMIVITNSSDPTPIADCPNGIVKARLPSGAEQCLQPLDWALAVHVSCNAVGRDFCLVSTHNDTASWPAYNNELFLVKLDGTQTLRLAHTRSSNGDYWRTPRAALSPDGRYALFDSDMGGSTIDVYLVALPASAPAPSPSPSPSPTPTPGPTPTPLPTPPPADLDVDLAPVPVTVDGVLGEWTSAPSVPLRGVSNTATASLLWDAVNLYVAFQVTDSQLSAKRTARDAAHLNRDDAVEVYIDAVSERAPLMQPHDYQFLVNVRNARGDLRGTGSGRTAAWSAAWSSAVRRDGTLNRNSDRDAGYTIEMAIPWSVIGVRPMSGLVLGLDLAVDDRDPGGVPRRDSFDWAGLAPDSYAQPSRWKVVRLR